MSYTWYKGNPNKYGNKKVQVNGRVFDSKKEARRYMELLALQKAGEIMDLQVQVKYLLIPAQYEEYKDAKGKKKRRCIERECAYYADFQYYDVSTDSLIVEDVKGLRTDVYKVKKKLMLYKYGIRIQEI